MSRNDWMPEEGGGLITSIKGFVVETAYFSTDPGYTEGVYLLHWLGTDGEGNEYTAEGFHPSWPVPNGFVSFDEGRTIQHPEGFKLRNNGWLGRLSKAIFEVTEGADPDPLDNFSPMEASGYVGLVVDLEQQEVDFGGQIGTKNRLMPVGYHGNQGVGATTTTDDYRTQVEELARGAASFEEFRSQALAVPGVSSDSSLVTQIIDQAGGIWSQVRG